mgnify:CR=1 FL=1
MTHPEIMTVWGALETALDLAYDVEATERVFKELRAAITVVQQEEPQQEGRG